MNSESAEQPQSPGNLEAPGAQLKARREAMGWSVEQVADQLKLASRQVIALEEGDGAALPNLAVVRGFIRAYAKVVKLDAGPLVAMIKVDPIDSHPETSVRREISATFSETRFPSLTQRSSLPKGWIIGALVLVAAGLGAYKLGLISPSMLMRAEKDAAHSSAPAAGGGEKPGLPASPAPLETTLLKPDLKPDLKPAPSPPVPLISAPPPVASTAPPVAAIVTPAVTAPIARAAVISDELVLTVREDSWVELRRVGAAPLISRVVKAGSSETFKVTERMLLIVGRPAGVAATLRGAALDLPATKGGNPSRVYVE